VALKPVMVEAPSRVKATAKKSPAKKTAAKKSPVGAMSVKDAAGQQSSTPPTSHDQ
jgi:NADH dehydrogenase